MKWTTRSYSPPLSVKYPHLPRAEGGRIQIFSRTFVPGVTLEMLRGKLEHTSTGKRHRNTLRAPQVEHRTCQLSLLHLKITLNFAIDFALLMLIIMDSNFIQMNISQGTLFLHVCVFFFINSPSLLASGLLSVPFSLPSATIHTCSASAIRLTCSSLANQHRVNKLPSDLSPCVCWTCVVDQPWTEFSNV